MRLCPQTPSAPDQRLRTLQAAQVPGTQGARHVSGLDIRLRTSRRESTGLGRHAVAPARRQPGFGHGDRQGLGHADAEPRYPEQWSRDATGHVSESGVWLPPAGMVAHVARQRRKAVPERGTPMAGSCLSSPRLCPDNRAPVSWKTRSLHALVLHALYTPSKHRNGGSGCARVHSVVAGFGPLCCL